MKPPSMDYNQVASSYNCRYQANPLSGVAEALHTLARRLAPAAILEVGCGTGRWLEEVQHDASLICGVDLSPGMLKQAQMRNGRFVLACCTAWQLPFPSATFDLIYCVHAFHHFSDQPGFIQVAHHLLRPGGALAIIGMDPHHGRDRYYLYDFFQGTLETDLQRFAPGSTIADWMQTAGFTALERGTADWIRESFTGEQVFEDPFLDKKATSQLTLLSDEVFQAGLEAMRAAILTSRAQGQTYVFEADIEVTMLTGFKSHPPGIS